MLQGLLSSALGCSHKGMGGGQAHTPLRMEQSRPQQATSSGGTAGLHLRQVHLSSPTHTRAEESCWLSLPTTAPRTGTPRQRERERERVLHSSAASTIPFLTRSRHYSNEPLNTSLQLPPLSSSQAPPSSTSRAPGGFQQDQQGHPAAQAQPLALEVMGKPGTSREQILARGSGRGGQMKKTFP